jgi:hypothetical protein
MKQRPQPKYLRQRDDFSCGPIALMNVLKWAGYNITYKDHTRFVKMCKCSKTGTFSDAFDDALRRYTKLMVLPDDGPFPAPKIELVDECLAVGGVVVFSYFYKYGGKTRISHLTVCIGAQDGRYVFVNDSPQYLKRTITTHKRKTVVKMLQFRDCGSECDVWFVHKVKV